MCAKAVECRPTPSRLSAVFVGSGIPGDCDQHGDIDLADYPCFEPCVSGPVNPAPLACAPFDFDQDNDVDLVDFQNLVGISQN